MDLTSAEIPPGRDALPAKRLPPRRLRARDVYLYRICEDLTEVLLYFMVLFSPWAFGSTQPWSIRVMNISGCLLGLLLALKRTVRWRTGYCPSRWGQKAEPAALTGFPQLLPKRLEPRWLTGALFGLTLALLAYCLLSAVNARATYQSPILGFAYHNCIRWLPHSLNSADTWACFWRYLGLACSFWAVWDWLLGKTDLEERAGRLKPTAGKPTMASFFPARLRRLLWVLALNGGLLGLEGIAQRLEGSGNLLFLVKPRVNPDAVTQFGPYAYRANAAQYFNLLWPVCLGFWWTLHRAGGFKRLGHHLLLIAGAIMAACPIISTSRGGALVAAGLVIFAAYFLGLAQLLLRAQRQETPWTRACTGVLLAFFCVSALGLGYWLGWKALGPRMARLHEGFEYREEMYEAARPMTRDYPVFGTGPGTFATTFQLYRASTDAYWPAQLHNDWLETRITFGWVGSVLSALACLLVILRWFAPGGIHGGRRFVILTWLALGGALAHARFDFPFQIHSILFLFLILCAILFVLSRRP